LILAKGVFHYGIASGLGAISGLDICHTGEQGRYHHRKPQNDINIEYELPNFHNHSLKMKTTIDGNC
jgi:hypothetical protein